jgi:CxxC-x17-CxxC domain-containing protein
MSGFTDKSLKCLDCGSDFTYTAAEQELHKSLGYQNEPKRCGACREAKRNRKGPRGGGGGAAAPRPDAPREARAPEGSGGPSREFFMAICCECGQEAQLPFKPRGDRPVYCSDCFSKRRSGTP